MMSDRGRPPSEHWYVPMPTVDREEIGQRKVEKLQKQIQNMEDEMKDRQTLIHKLSRLKEVESGRRELDEKVLERNSVNSSPRLLHEELERLYGQDSPVKTDRQSSPLNRALVQTVIQHRTKEFSAKQQETALQAKYLDQERRKLQEARERVQEQRRALLQSKSPADSVQSEPGPSHPPTEAQAREGQYSLPVGTGEVQGVDSYIQKTVQTLPSTVNKIWEMREGLEKHYNYYRRPYNGELGIRSYEHWQLKDYFMVRQIVEDVVDDFLNLYLPHDHLVERETYHAMLDEEKKWVSKQSESLAEKKAVLLIAEELVLDETGSVIQDVVQEMAHMYGSFRNMTDTMLMAETEKVSTGQDTERDPSDRVYNMVTKAYFSLKENRNRHRKKIWGHSQHVQNKLIKRQIKRKGGKVVEGLQRDVNEGEEEEEEKEEEEEEEEDLDAPDVTVLDFNTLTPTMLKNLDPSPHDTPEIAEEKELMQRYMKREIVYWKNLQPEVQTLTIARQCRGVQMIKASPNHRYIAVGTFHGDIIVYDAILWPWRPFRALRNQNNSDDYLLELAWSLNSTRLIVINVSGILHVLDISSGLTNKTDAKKLALPVDDKGIYPQQLQLLLALDVDQRDFTFQQGNLAEDKVLDDTGVVPVRAAFFPSFTFLGSQNEMMIGLDSGDVLKCNFENTLMTAENEAEINAGSQEAPRIYKPPVNVDEEASRINRIGQNLGAELFRGHQHAIICMTFVEHLNMLVTVDQKGFINKWKYSLKFRSSYGWFTPAQKYRLETSKIMYKETGTDKPKVIFTDKSIPGRQMRTRQEIAVQRRKVQNIIDNMHLGSPWHEEYLPKEDLTMQVFTPRGNIAQSGAMFHILYKHEETDQLSKYITRLYKPVKVRCTRIVQVKSSPSSTEIIVVLLFNRYPPKDAHFTILIVDIVSMELRDVRKDVPVKDADYAKMTKKSILSCDVSRVFGPTGSDYLFMMFNGKLRCVSLTSGQTVFKVENMKNPSSFDGCTLDEIEVDLPLDAEVTAVCVEGFIYCVAFARKCAKIFVVAFWDENPYQDRRTMWKTYTSLPDHRVMPVELRVDTHNWDLGDVQHPSVAVRKMILRNFDAEMRDSGFFQDHPKVIHEIALQDKVENYRVLDKLVTSSNLLEKEGVMEGRLNPHHFNLPQQRKPLVEN